MNTTIKNLIPFNNAEQDKLDKTIKVIKIINGILVMIGFIGYAAMVIKIFRNLYKTTEDVKIENNLKAKRKGQTKASYRVQKYDKLVEKYHALWQKAKDDEKFYSECYVDSKGNLRHDGMATVTNEE